MPRRKISVEDAFQALQKAGINVQPVPVEPEPVVPKKVYSNPYGLPPKSVRQTGPRTVRVELYAKHTVGSGGEQVVGADGHKQTVNNGVVTYGPGVCQVPVGLAKHLLHQDAMAKEADERFLSSKPRYCLVVQKVDQNGNRYAVPVEVSLDVLDPGNMVTNIPQQYSF